jgi:hypothetical protein
MPMRGWHRTASPEGPAHRHTRTLGGESLFFGGGGAAAAAGAAGTAGGPARRLERPLAGALRHMDSGYTYIGSGRCQLAGTPSARSNWAATDGQQLQTRAQARAHSGARPHLPHLGTPRARCAAPQTTEACRWSAFTSSAATTASTHTQRCGSQRMAPHAPRCCGARSPTCSLPAPPPTRSVRNGGLWFLDINALKGAAAPRGSRRHPACTPHCASCDACPSPALLLTAAARSGLAARAGTFDLRSLTRLSSRQHGPRRCKNAATPSLSHVAVYGDAMAPAIELQYLKAGKFAFLEGHMAQVGRPCVLML